MNVRLRPVDRRRHERSIEAARGRVEPATVERFVSDGAAVDVETAAALARSADL
jgi:hypothetical protein